MDSAPTLRLGPRALAVSLRPYDAKDEDAAVSLWLRSWQTAYPQIDFAQRLDWWRERWRNELTKSADIFHRSVNFSSMRRLWLKASSLVP